MKPTLYLVIPCYNEQEVLPLTAPTFLAQIHRMQEDDLISSQSRILFVNDGSRDKTWEIITKLADDDPTYIGIAQSRNRGHQNAVWAGLMEARNRCDITISIDCDGQDDILAMSQMVREYLDGCDVVYGVRDDRTSDSWFKRTSAQGFYKLLNIMDAPVVYNHADYRLISSRALAALSEFKEVNLYLRGMVPLVGFKSTCVYYKRTERLAGKSHYPLRKMLSLALNGITSLSTKPLRLISGLGILMSLAGFACVIWAIIAHLIGNTIAGWTSIVAIVGLMGGIQLVCLGVIGEYIGKMYMEIKQRPRYIISERTDDHEQEKSE